MDRWAVHYAGFTLVAVEFFFASIYNLVLSQLAGEVITLNHIEAALWPILYCGFLGQHAVHAAMSGKTGMVVANIMDKFVHLPLELVTRKRRTMSVRSDLWQSVLETTGQGDVMGTSPEPEQHL